MQYTNTQLIYRTEKRIKELLKEISKTSTNNYRWILINTLKTNLLLWDIITIEPPPHNNLIKQILSKEKN